MDINVTIYETKGITSGFIVCNIVAPTYDQFKNTGYDKNIIGTTIYAYNKNNVGNVIASQNIPGPNISGTGILIPFLGLTNVPYCFVEVMVSPDGSREKGLIWNVCGYNNTVGETGRLTEINNPKNIPDPSSSYIHYII